MPETTGLVIDDQGSGAPIVLVHGLGSRMEAFDPIKAQLARDHRVIAVDLPGFGRAPTDPDVEPGAIGYARWLRRVLADLGIENPHIVGSSMGGGVALELGRIGVASRVTAFSPIGFWRSPGISWCQGLLTVLKAGGTQIMPFVRAQASSTLLRTALTSTLVGKPAQLNADATVLSLEGLIGSQSFEAARDSFSDYRLEAWDNLGGLADIPVTIAWGDKDAVLTHRTQARRARAIMPQARHLDLPGCGHLPFSDDPELCVRTVLDQH
jgi:pimeloyl-ACP methyl ester carboxylesterase